MVNPQAAGLLPGEPAGAGAWRLRVAVDAPIWGALDYSGERELAPGTVVRVPLGRQTVCGVVLEALVLEPGAAEGLKAVHEACEALQPLGAEWIELLRFTADYYQRPLGELMAAALPGWLREQGARAVERRLQAARRAGMRYRLSPQGREQLARSLGPRSTALWRLAEALGLPAPRASGAQAPAAQPPAEPPAAAAAQAGALHTLDEAGARRLHPRGAALLREWASLGWLCALAPEAPPAAAGEALSLHAEQEQALRVLAEQQGFGAHLLFGVTGSGKTEVYLRAVQRVLERDPRAQALVLTPEINLTPQLLRRFAERFPGERLALLHSGLAEAERFDHWAAAHAGHARIVLGTRLAVLSSLPGLALVVVDEEHDPSYKQQEGARYSARDLAVWRARQRGVPVLLGSATPSLESWHAATQGRYGLLRMQQRASGALPRVRLLPSHHDPLLRAGGPIGQILFDALTQRLEQGEQSLLFLNRRGYAPVLCCPDCGWKSDCPHCDAHLVYHRDDRSLRCHHCGHRAAVPRACPDCGSLDLQPLGRGTQRVQEALAQLFPQARIARIDADTASRKGQAEAGFAQVHAGEVDILVGTQMVTKGHDFQRVSLVAALNPDAGLFSHDPRAPERLFAQLVQAAGRAGRAGGSTLEPQMLVQTAYPEHPLYQALQRNDYAGFAERELLERRRAGMPPFSFQALLRAEHAREQRLQEFVEQAAELAAGLVADAGPTIYPPVPASLARLAGVHRLQLLVEAPRRALLHAFLARWRQALQDLRGGVRWAIDVDPTEF
ncbi:primosomal protein N' [Thiomonas sp. FB-6]|uniref:primosomal protein N' n=1 Tax=Thiomonas sp. FB-6 TaxID=1158291 RepID=UPI0003A213AA|nr:primosomal protein N' [Thiomonas sp. FB-6]